MLDNVLAMVGLLCAWAWQVGMFFGVGRVTRSLLRCPPGGLPVAWLDFWLGASVAVSLALVWHFFLPIDAALVACLSGVALVGLWWSREELRAGLRALGRGDAVVAVLLAAFAVWLSNDVLGAPDNPDSAAYHVQEIQWLTAFRAVPGIGNVNPCFGHNQTFFIYAALVNAGPFARLAYHVTNGPLALASMAACLRGVVRTAQRARPWSPSDGVAALFAGPLLYQAVQRAANPSPDYAVFLLGFLLGCGLVALLETPSPHPRAIACFTLLAAWAVTVKLVLVGIAVPALALLCVREGLRQRKLGFLVPVTVIGAWVFVPWVVSGVIQSGYPLFPSSLFAAPVDWRMPREEVAAVADVVRAWGRFPGHASSEVLGSSDWITHWWEQAWLMNVDFLIPACLAVLGGVALAVRRRAGWARLAALSVVAAALAFWWWSSPDLRFAGASLWLAAALALSFNGRAAVLACAGAVLAGIVLTTHPLSRAHPGGAVPLPLATLATYTTDSGLLVRLGDSTHAPCWDAPVPCVPIQDPALSLRRPGDLASGFRSQPTGDRRVDWAQMWERSRW